jgi:hypothetical protein
MLIRMMRQWRGQLLADATQIDRLQAELQDLVREN